ncbi:hypothetical protein ASD24_04870 [Paenibacillus sp. Root52]|uniref:Uncharacterized protein n=1 Tax=Paenibacillus amylolyticus TaxID=1451 RepID=A0AAP5LNM4_PAEAM|nr:MULTISPECIES: hypothetical protein [Paenibacillus]KQY94874.1 hypothetical protein ASD24_04870 [Paenibacillus sp. Root52]MDR6723815.1 hypothetical protein [Paenibacillus amylolyticus]
MQVVWQRSLLVAYYLIWVLALATGKIGLLSFILTTFFILALYAIVFSLSTTDQFKLDQFVYKLRAVIQVTVAVILTSLLVKLIFLFV